MPEGTRQTVIIDSRGDHYGSRIKSRFFMVSHRNRRFRAFLFSTICYNLEGGKWGSRFPYLMNSLYQGELSYNDLDSAKEELTVIIEEFKEFSPDQVIWDIEDLSKQPPWGNNISPEIKNLSDYFITCDGENIFDEIIKAFKEAKAEKQNIILTSL